MRSDDEEEHDFEEDEEDDDVSLIAPVEADDRLSATRRLERGKSSLSSGWMS